MIRLCCLVLTLAALSACGPAPSRGGLSVSPTGGITVQPAG
jgi:hypothetical protein